MAQWVMCLMHKCEDLSFNPQNLHKARHGWLTVPSFYSDMGGEDWRLHRSLWASMP